ncbi:homocysteine S-methyltransferase family protein [Shimia ponticola]|uniref:homocysteine S-methyltransferase family protein n=1 Tax=Shimia ponticola TaxID=2582893 RepID=UPI0011BD6C72|nr:homocysteine S-methyltransferase family protein [Shimia ponticola]
MGEITILDGGMGQELIKRAGQATPLWSVQALLDAPELVRAVHDDFFAAGAQVATVNTYSVRPDRLSHHGLGDQFAALQQLACRIAVEARDAHGSGLVLGGMAPLGFSYRPELAPPLERAVEVFSQMADLQAPFVDGYILETMGSVEEARGAVMGCATQGKPVWLSVTVSDEDGTRLRSGEPLVDVLPLCEEFGVAVLSLNCSFPEAITVGVPEVARKGFAIGAYANGFTKIADGFDNDNATVDMLSARTDLGPEAYLEFAKRWADAGATVIGGCCEVGPDHIRALARHFKGTPV